MYMEESPDMSRVKEPRAMVAVLIFGAVFMVGFGIWHAPILEFASEAVPNLAETMTIISTNSTEVSSGSGTGVNEVPGVFPPLSSSFMLEQAEGTHTN
jgi:hypothetical protein